MSDSLRPPSHDLVCEPNGIQDDDDERLVDALMARALEGRTCHAWASRPPPCPGCVSLEAQMAAWVKRATEAERQSAELLLEAEALRDRVKELEARRPTPSLFDRQMGSRP